MSSMQWFVYTATNCLSPGQRQPTICRRVPSTNCPTATFCRQRKFVDSLQVVNKLLCCILWIVQINIACVLAYLGQPIDEPLDHVEDQVAVSDELSIYDNEIGISSIYSVIENMPGSSANAESLPAAEMAYSPQLGLPPVPDIYDRITLTEYVNANPDDAASSALEASYSGLEASIRELPPVPFDVYDRMTQHEYFNTETDDAASSAQETPYSRLESATRELPPVPADNDRMTQPKYVNANPNDAASSAQLETSYSVLESSTLEPPPAVAVYDTITKPEYVNTNPDDAASSAVETSYCGLESSTLELPPAPAVYETVIKPEYVNVNGAATEVMSATNSEGPNSDAGISPNVSPSST